MHRVWSPDHRKRIEPRSTTVQCLPSGFFQFLSPLPPSLPFPRPPSPPVPLAPPTFSQPPPPASSLRRSPPPMVLFRKTFASCFQPSVNMGARNPTRWDRNFQILDEIVNGIRFFSSKSNPALDLRNLRSMIVKRAEERGRDFYPVQSMVPVARDVLQARRSLYDGVSTLVQHIPVWSCKYCPEVYVGEGGHLIKTCPGSKHRSKNSVHTWVKGGLNDVIVPVETFHLQKMFQDVIKHRERFDHDRIPAVVELCLQAGIDSNDQSVTTQDVLSNKTSGPETLSVDDLRWLATRTLHAWETLKSGVRRLLWAYPARVCRHCLEVHVGPFGHDARMCGVFKHQAWHGKHSWKKAEVYDLVPQKMVWSRRRQDPPILIDEGRGYYGHAPAVVDLCSKAGAMVPSRYFAKMKLGGLTAPVE